ncbi:MAG: hypothetical protein DRH12_11365 [Deltaproteobacteria bacterium]|nr:MAG: hypothetical protein DRH12_11365 [Deltaproteobacteria bacterium]
MKKAKIGIIEGYGGAILQTIGNAVRELNEQGWGCSFEVQARHQANEIEERFFQWLKDEADAILLHLNTADESFERIKELVSSPSLSVPVFCMQEGLSNVPLDVLAVAKQYHLHGGLKNTKNLLLFLGQYCGKITGEVPPPEELPWQGIYHPDAEGIKIFESLEGYNAWYDGKHKDKQQPTVGLLLFRTAWLEGDTAMWDAVIREFEGKGVKVVPVISRGFEDKDFGIEKNDAILERYFIADGKPVIDLLLNFQMFFLVPRVIKGWGEHSTGGIEILKRLNVPVIQAVRSYHRTLDEWKESGEGLDPTGIVMNVAMPEFDGIIEPILIGVVEKARDATVGGTYNKHAPVQEQVEYLVARCIKWVRLKETPVSERRVAFILHNPPCKSVEATVGTGFGLDTLESVVRIFHRMEKEGYSLGDWLPDNSKALIDEIMERKAISEFRWTPLSEIVKKGGAAAMLDRGEYLKWFYEFPESAQNEIIGTWGDPASDFSKSEEEQSETEAAEEINWAKLSMSLYDDKIVIPGIKYGNVFLTVQPKRGCAGARCDGEVCKILHDPTCPPPHQWLAVYKWIEKEFKADAIVHVGKHGYMEFLPGKSVGLSNECYPQISLCTVPHLYIYIVNNPMEGTIAKRRGYATLVDHLIPVMAPSGLYEGLEELEDLLAQHNKAKTTNDNARLRSLLQLITEKAEEVNLLKGLEGKEEEVVDYLHGQLTLLRETQIRDGLHILGEVPSGKNLANLLVSILRFDIGEQPSIRRGVLECRGLDYEEVIENPSVLSNEFGRTNGELLDESMRMAVKIFEEIFSGVEAEAASEPLATVTENEIFSTCKEIIGCDLKKGSEELVKAVKFGL